MSLAISWWPLIRDDWEIEEIGYGLAEFLSKPEPWKAKGACVGKDPAIFFMPQGKSSKEAKEICMTCTVRQECEDYANRTQSEGVWSGELRTPKVRKVQNARPVRVSEPERKNKDQVVVHPGFGTIAARKNTDQP